MPGNSQMPEILFLPRARSAAETWTGHMYSPQEANQISGIKEIWRQRIRTFVRAFSQSTTPTPQGRQNLMTSFGEALQTGSVTGFESLFEAAAKNEAELYLLVPREVESGNTSRTTLAADWARSATNYVIKNATRFSPKWSAQISHELRLMQHAIDITTEAHERAWAVAGSCEMGNTRLTRKWLTL